MSQNKEHHSKDISRKAALKKMGSYAAFTALGTMIMLNPQKAQAQSGPPGPPTGNGNFQNSPIQGVRRNRNKK